MSALLFVSMLVSAPSAEERPSVLLVTLDTFRGDFIGASGSRRSSTPSLDRLARRGALFTRARAAAPLTLPSHASILTGLYPPEHGVRGNGSFRLDDSCRTIAESLRDSGYETAAFVSSFVLDRRFGLGQGFETYDDDLGTGTPGLESPEAERVGERVLEAFDDWLRRRDGRKPFFAWVHLYDPHFPYAPPEPFLSRFASDGYAGEIAYTDWVVGEIVGRVAESTLVAVVGDHGEGLGEHGEATHSLLVYNSTLHVPLILAGGGIPRGRAVESLARTIDLPSTILDYLGLAPDLGSGRSLRPLLEERDDPPRTAYAESLYGLHQLGFSPLYALESGDHRLIDAPRRELYDLASNPGETRELLQERRSVSRELFRALTDLRSSFGTSSAAGLVLDAETRDKLASLGYLTSSAPASRPGETLPDPKDQMELFHRIQQAQDRKSRSDCGAVIETLGGIRKAGTSIPLVYELLASCHLELGQWESATAAAKEALSRGIETSALHRDLGLAALRQGKPLDAEREFRVALALDPANVVAHHQLGDALRAQRRDEEAAAAYREALELNPRYVFAWNGLGMTLARGGKNEEALQAFRKVLELDPTEPRGIFNLAVHLDRTGARGEAIELYRRFLEISTEDVFPRERARAREALRAEAPRPKGW